jgi:hypothetical protein
MKVSEAGSTREDFPFAKIHCTDERPHEAVGTSSGLDAPAASPDGLFEHPEGCNIFLCHNFSRAFRK